MAVQFAGSISQVAKRITRRSSFAQAGSTKSPFPNEHPALAELPSPMPRSQSFAAPVNHAIAVPLRHTLTDSTNIGRSRGPRTVRSMSTFTSNISQNGLEAMDTIREFQHRNEQTEETPSMDSHQNLKQRRKARAPGTETAQREDSLGCSTGDHTQTLLRLIRERCPEITLGPEIELPSRRVRDASVPDRTHAHDLLVTARTADPKYTDPSSGLRGRLRSKHGKERAADSHSWIFSHQELGHALKKAIEHGHIGVAEVLLEMGADVNILKDEPKHSFKVLRKSRPPRPTNHIQTAVATRNAEMVNLLASHDITKHNLDEALEQAVKQNSRDVMLTLLQYGANPNAMLGNIFRSAVTSQNIEIVKLLLRARDKVDKALLTDMLPVTVSQGQRDLAALLVAYGADVNSNHASGLRAAVQKNRIDIVLTLMKGKPSSQAVTSVIEDTVSMNNSNNPEERYLLVEILLCGGATGDPAAKTLVQVVKAGYRGIARLLVTHGVSLQYNHAEALRIVIKKQDIEFLRTLLLGEVSQDCANQLFMSIPHPYTRNHTCETMTALIAKGAMGVPLDKALVTAVQQKLMNIVNLLLDHKACVDYDDAKAIRMSVSAGDLDCFHVLLSKGRPRPSSLQYVLPLVPSNPPYLKFDMTQAIFGIATPNAIPVAILETALVKSVDSSESSEADLNLVNLLIVAGVNVECWDGMCIKFAVERGSPELLEILLGKTIHSSKLSPAIAAAMQIRCPDLKRRMIGVLLDHGGDGSSVSQALIDGLCESPIDESLISLLLTKSDINYHGGHALAKAVETCTSSVVAKMIKIGKPNHSSRLSALSCTLQPRTQDRENKLQLLIQAGIRQPGLDTALIHELENGLRSSERIVDLLLGCNASCNHDNGKALRLVISQSNRIMLRTLIKSGPSPEVLANMLPLAMQIVDAHVRLGTVTLLLEGGAKGEEVNEALSQEVLAKRSSDLQLVKLFIHYGARVDYKDAVAIKSTISDHPYPELLRILVSGTGATNILSSLIPLAMNLTEKLRLPLLRLLLEAGAHGHDIHASLVKAVSEGTQSQATIELLLQHNASVNFDHGKAIKNASGAGLCSILSLLLEKKPKRGYLIEALPLAMQAFNTHVTKDDVPSRLSCVRLLTRAGVRKCQAVDLALLQAVQQRDHALVSQLIQSEADPNFGNGESVCEATKHTDIQSLTLLATAKPKPTPRVYSDAFAVITDSPRQPKFEPSLSLSIIKILLIGGASGPPVNRALASLIPISHDPVANQHMNMILGHCSSLDPDYDRGKSLCAASRLLLHHVVQDLMNRRPNTATLHSAFLSLFESKSSSEAALITMLGLFFGHMKEEKSMLFEHKGLSDNPLYQCLHCHGEKPDLLRCLLDNGCRTDVTFDWIFSPEHGEEKVSPLLWLLCQERRVERRIVDILLERGADASYQTLRSRSTPLIVAAYSAQPDLVLQLLEAHAKLDAEDIHNRTALWYATSAGSLQSMKHLLTYQADPNNESLHLAASKANASMIKLLLDNGGSEEYPGTISCEGRTPLGELCRNATPEIDSNGVKASLRTFQNARLNYMKLSQNKSLVIHALDNDSPLSMTRLLLATYSFLRQNLNADFNIFTSKSRKRYSLTMYVRHYKCIESIRKRSVLCKRSCCSLKACPCPPLEKLLRSFGCQDRYWDDKAGANQPVGACGFPPHIIEAIEEAAAERKRLEEQARERAERRARREERQAELDAEARRERQREEDRLALKEAERRADAEEDERQLAAVRKADRVRKEQKTMEFEEEQDRRRAAAREEENRVKKRDMQRIKTLKEEARIESGVYRERQRFLDGVSGVMREAQIAGIGNQGLGRVLGEIGVDVDVKRLT